MNTESNRNPKVVMLLGTLPPMPIGGAEKQAMMLTRSLNDAGVEAQIIGWGKLWHKTRDNYHGLEFTRIKTFLNIIPDLLSLFKTRRKKTSSPTKIFYDDKKETTNRITGKVWTGMIIRYQLFYLGCLFYLWRRRKSFDIIHVHMMEWPAFIAVKIGRILKKPVVIKDSTMNGITNLLRYPAGEKKQKEVAAYAEFVAMTTVIRNNLLAAGIPDTRITGIPNGIRVTPPPERPAWSNTVIFVGNLTQQPAKGIDILLLAWKEVLKKVPTAILQIAGSGDIETYQEYLKSEGMENSVDMLGKRNDIPHLLNSADVFVLPSRREGMSNALMEAMILAMPVVATRVSGSEDLIENNHSGMLVPVADVQALAAALQSMLENAGTSIQMGKAAYQSVAQKCNIDKVAAQYIQLYNKITNKN